MIYLIALKLLASDLAMKDQPYTEYEVSQLEWSFQACKASNSEKECDAALAEGAQNGIDRRQLALIVEEYRKLAEAYRAIAKRTGRRK